MVASAIAVHIPLVRADPPRWLDPTVVSPAAISENT